MQDGSIRRERQFGSPDDSVLNTLAGHILHIADALMPERPLHAYQREFGRAVSLAVLGGASEEITALFARQSGKTETTARIAAALMILLPSLAQTAPLPLPAFHHGIWLGIFAPVKEQASTSFQRLAEIFLSPRGRLFLAQFGLQPIEDNKAAFILSNGSSVRIASTAPISHIESRTLHLAVVEEAQDVDDLKIRKSIEPMLTATAGTLVLVGTANTRKSLFWESIQNNRKRQYNHPEQRCHFEYDWTTVIQHNSRYRSFLNAKVLTRGRGWLDSDAFRMAYGCEFILERGQFMPLSRLLELEALGRDIERGPYDAYGLCRLSAPVVAGIDWGKSGDSTVATVIARYEEFYRIVDWLELAGDDYDSQFDSLVAFLRRFPTLQRVLSESNGVGDPMTDRLQKAARVGRLNAPTTGFLASEAHNSDGYKNLLIDFVHGNRLHLPANPESRQSREYQRFAEQLTGVVKEWRGSLLKVHAPPKSHDDYVSSLMIAYWAASRTGSGDMFGEFYRHISSD
jgi:hypothetical protein